jgi:hypothetical protein
MQKLVNN